MNVRAAGGPDQLVHAQVATPAPGRGAALVRVYAAALTRDELEWPVDRLPAIPSYELSGVVVGLGTGADGVTVGDQVFAMTAFDATGRRRGCCDPERAARAQAACAEPRRGGRRAPGGAQRLVGAPRPRQARRW